MRRSARLESRLSSSSIISDGGNDAGYGKKFFDRNFDVTPETKTIRLNLHTVRLGKYKKPPFKDSTKSAKHFKSVQSSEAANNENIQNDSDSIGVGSDILEMEIRTNNVDVKVNANDIMNYQKLREANLKSNLELFAKLGFMNMKTMINDSKPPKPSHRGLQMTREVQNRPTEIRRSLRIKRIDPLGVPLPEPVVQIVENGRESRHPSGPLEFKDTIYLAKKEHPNSDKEINSFQSLLSNVKSVKCSQSYSLKTFLAKLQKVEIAEHLVAKVVPGRVFSLAWHPSSEKLISIAGDKYGHVGFWNVLEQENNALVTAFKPHTGAVSHVAVSPLMSQKLYSSSYDATLRCGDFEKGVFDEIFSLPEESDLFRNFDFVDSHNTMLVSQYSGNVSFIDTRTPTTTAELVYSVSKKSLRSVSVNPVKPHYFITAGNDSFINVWDLRYISQKSPKPIQSLHKHAKAVSSAYFSPGGNSILSSSSDNTILLFDVDESMKVELKKHINHNNNTGRWLTKFQPQWHPKVDGIFATGSMNRPREIEVFDSQGTKLRSLTNADFLLSVCSLNAFHPNMLCTLVGANSSGRLFVFM